MRSPDPALIAAAAERLRAGGVVAFPTETVYGLGADALDADAVARVFALKGRPANNPLIVHVADAAMARRVASAWPADADALAATFWPGPLTIVLPKAPCIPPAVVAGGRTVGVRCPDHPVALALIRAFAGPIVGPSANRSGSISPTRAEHVAAAFRQALDTGEMLLLDGGPCRTGIESTVLSLADETPRVLRRGVITPAEIEAVLGRRVETLDSPVPADAPLPSPGLLERHYAPAAPARLFDAVDWPEVLDAAPGSAVVLTHARARAVHPPHALIRLPLDAPAYASRLYAALHEADALRPALILIERPTGEGPLWDALRDRLTRACAK